MKTCSYVDIVYATTRSVTRGENASGVSLGGAESPNYVASTSIQYVLLPKDLRFKNGGAKRFLLGVPSNLGTTC